MLKKLSISAITVIIALLSSVVAVSAYSLNLDYNLSKFYDVWNKNGSVNSMYHTGSWVPWDDVSSRTRVASVGGLSVTAKATTYGNNGMFTRSWINQKNVNGYVDSGWAKVDGTDYAYKVVHESYRKFIGDNYVDTIIYYIT